MIFDFLKYHKRILFVGGLWNNVLFERSIKEQLKRYRRLSFKACREVTQEDIDNNEVIICYSIAIQYVYKLNTKGKKIILVSPLLNNDLIKEQMIFVANHAIEQFSKTGELNPILNFLFNTCGGDEKSNNLWWNDMKNWIKKYPNNEKVVDIEPKKTWIIIEGRMPICKLPWVNIKTPYGHMIPINDDWHFLDKAI